jgi:hypothetical protein
VTEAAPCGSRNPVGSTRRSEPADSRISMALQRIRAGLVRGLLRRAGDVDDDDQRRARVQLVAAAAARRVEARPRGVGEPRVVEPVDVLGPGAEALGEQVRLDAWEVG